MDGDRVRRRVKPPRCSRCTGGYVRCDDPECGLCGSDRAARCPRATVCPDCGWHLDGALAMLRPLSKVLQKVGWGVGLTGSVLLEGVSANDLDILVYPLDGSEVSRSALFQALESWGWIRQCEVFQTHATWRRRGSLDCKAVEIWRDGVRRVDVFILG